MASPAPSIKVCGITREADASALVAAGVNWIGINLYGPSPRSVTLARAREIINEVPTGQRVLVDVEPTLQKLADCKAAGFDRFQLHFKPANLPEGTLDAWADLLGRDNLWLAPKLPPQTPFPTEILNAAETLLLDAYSKDAYGGTGKTANWELFRELKSAHPRKNWILAGGLNPLNLLEAVQSTGTQCIDLNSGFETAPGLKDTAQIAETLSRIVGLHH